MCNQSFCINNFHWINDSIFLGFTCCQKISISQQITSNKIQEAWSNLPKKKKKSYDDIEALTWFFFTLLQNMKQQIPNHITIYTKKITNSMYTYTQTEHKYTYRSNGLKSKINSIDQMSSENQTVHRKKSYKKKKWWNQNQADQ